ncbi:hypothetical protein [Nonomuraea sp. NPDC048826]|uniref:hypothetical protein n=1 Tax=Nonomuraea sp. NPDC048826 TaxID=3364347 RepID=UPI00371D084B
MDRAQVDLTDPESRQERLDAFVALLHEVVFPWFAGTRDPRDLAATLDERTLAAQPVSLAEWLVSLGMRDQARLLIERYWCWSRPVTRGSRPGLRPRAPATGSFGVTSW